MSVQHPGSSQTLSASLLQHPLRAAALYTVLVRPGPARHCPLCLLSPPVFFCPSGDSVLSHSPFSFLTLPMNTQGLGNGSKGTGQRGRGLNYLDGNLSSLVLLTSFVFCQGLFGNFEVSFPGFPGLHSSSASSGDRCLCRNYSRIRTVFSAHFQKSATVVAIGHRMRNVMHSDEVPSLLF